MAETILKNIGNFEGRYGEDEITFSTNEVSTVIVSGISAYKSSDKPVWVNGPMTYTITVRNDSAEDLTNVILTDMLDPAIIALVPNSVMVNGVTAAYTYFSGVLTVNLPLIAQGGIVTVTFRVTQV